MKDQLPNFTKMIITERTTLVNYAKPDGSKVTSKEPGTYLVEVIQRNDNIIILIKNTQIGAPHDYLSEHGIIFN